MLDLLSYRLHVDTVHVRRMFEEHELACGSSPIHIALSYDEEVPCLGVRSLLDDARRAIRFSELSVYPGLATDAQSQAAQLIAQFCGSSEFTTVAFGTEGGLFDAIGIPTVVCGPGSMDQGRKPDEFVSVEQLEACDAMLERISLVLHV